MSADHGVYTQAVGFNFDMRLYLPGTIIGQWSGMAVGSNALAIGRTYTNDAK